MKTSVSLTKVAFTLNLLVARTVITTLTEGQIDRQRIRSPVSLLVVSQHQELKYVNDASCVGQLCSVKTVPNVQTVVQDPPVGARLQFGKPEKLWRPPKVRKNSQRRLHPSFLDPTKLDKGLTIISC